MTGARQTEVWWDTSIGDGPRGIEEHLRDLGRRAGIGAKMPDIPIEKARKDALELNAKGINTYQKFTCAKCGNRLTMEDANIFYDNGRCDACGHVSEITHCGYMVHARGPSVETLMKDMLRRNLK